MMAEFALVSFVAPSIPDATPLLTSTLDLLATPTITLVAQGTGVSQRKYVAQATQQSRLLSQVVYPGKLISQSRWMAAKFRESLKSKAQHLLRFWLLQIREKTIDQSEWLTILAGNEIKQDASLGSWNTSLLTPENTISVWWW